MDRKSSPFDPTLGSLVTVRVSQVNWFVFCVGINSATGLKRGVSQAQLEALKDGDKSPLFSERGKVALFYTDAITYSDRQRIPEGWSLRFSVQRSAISSITGIFGKPFAALNQSRRIKMAWSPVATPVSRILGQANRTRAQVGGERVPYSSSYTVAFPVSIASG